MKIFAERLKALRKDRGLTQDDIVKVVVESTGMSFHKGYISKWENNKVNPDISSIVPLAEYFNVSLDYLIGLTDDPSPVRKEELVLETDEKVIIHKYRELNRLGKEYIFEQLDNATQLPKYKKGEGEEQKMA